MSLLKHFQKLSRAIRLTIKRVIFFHLIVYAAYIFIDSFMPLCMVEFWFRCCIAVLGRRVFGDKLLVTIE